MPRDWVDRHRPARPSSFINRRQQFHVKRDRLRHAVHCEVAKNVATLRAGAFYVPAFERDPGKLLDIKKFCAAQMIVAFFDLGVDASNVNLRSDRGTFRTFPVDFDPAAEARKFAAGRAKELMHTESDGGARRIELVAVLC